MGGGLKIEIKKQKFRGVRPAYKGKWSAHIKRTKHFIWLGTFNSEQEAAIAYDKKAFEFYGEDAILNFPGIDGRNIRLITRRQELIYRLVSPDFMAMTYANAAKHLNITVSQIQAALKTIQKHCPFLFPIRIKNRKGSGKRKWLFYENWMENYVVQKF